MVLADEHEVVDVGRPTVTPETHMVRLALRRVSPTGDTAAVAGDQRTDLVVVREPSTLTVPQDLPSSVEDEPVEISATPKTFDLAAGERADARNRTGAVGVSDDHHLMPH